MRAKALAFLTQRRILFAAHTPALGHHLEVLAFGLLAVGRAAGHFFLFLPLVAAKLLAALAASVDTRHTFFVVCFGLLARAQNVRLVQYLVAAGRPLLGQLQRCQLAPRPGASCAACLGRFLGRLEPQLIELGEVGGREDARRR